MKVIIVSGLRFPISSFKILLESRIYSKIIYENLQSNVEGKTSFFCYDVTTVQLLETRSTKIASRDK